MDQQRRDCKRNVLVSEMFASNQNEGLNVNTFVLDEFSILRLMEIKSNLEGARQKSIVHLSYNHYFEHEFVSRSFIP